VSDLILAERNAGRPERGVPLTWSVMVRNIVEAAVSFQLLREGCQVIEGSKHCQQPAVGIYSAAQLIGDVWKHGGEIQALNANRSDCDSTHNVRSTGSTIRLRLRMVGVSIVDVTADSFGLLDLSRREPLWSSLPETEDASLLAERDAGEPAVPALSQFVEVMAD